MRLQNTFGLLECTIQQEDAGYLFLRLYYKHQQLILSVLCEASGDTKMQMTNEQSEAFQLTTSYYLIKRSQRTDMLCVT